MGDTNPKKAPKKKTNTGTKPSVQASAAVAPTTNKKK